MNNPITNVYSIDRSVENVITVHTADDDIEFKVPSSCVVGECYMTRFTFLDDTNGSMSGKYLQFTDINGMSAEVIVDVNDDEESLYHSLKCGDIALDMDYLYIGAKFDNSDEVSPIYINLKEKGNDGVSAE